MKFHEFLYRVLPDKMDQDCLQELCIEHYIESCSPKTILFIGVSKSGKSALERIIEDAVPNFKHTIITANEQHGMEGFVFHFASPSPLFELDSKDIQDIMDNDKPSIINFMTGVTK